MKRFEGLVLHAYPDPGTGGAPWTIGYGRAHGVAKGDLIDEATAEDFLREDLATAAEGVSKLVKVGLSQGEFDALCSFALNCGVANLRSSTLLRRVNENDFDSAADEFLRWNKAAGRVLPGLTRRREAERDLFRS